MDDDLVLGAAKRLFSQKGYVVTTLSDIAKQLRVTKGTLYYHWPRKIDILIRIVEDFLKGPITQMRHVERSTMAPQEKLRAFILVYVNTVLTNRDSARTTFEELRNVPHTEALLDLHQQIQDVLDHILAEGVRRGIFSAQYRFVKMHVLATACWPYRWFRDDGSISRDDFIDEVMRFCLKALGADHTQALGGATGKTSRLRSTGAKRRS